MVLHDGAPSGFHLSEAVVIPARVINMLLTLGPYVYRDAAVFTKVREHLFLTTRMVQMVIKVAYRAGMMALLL